MYTARLPTWHEWEYVAAADERLSVLELFHGPTAAFKDFGARFLAAALGPEGLATMVANMSGADGHESSVRHGGALELRFTPGASCWAAS